VSTTIGRRRLALAVLFFLPGVGIASWVTRTPAIRDLLGASTAEMGLVLLGLSVGSMAGILCSGALVLRFGARPVIAVGVTAVILSMPTIGIGAELGSAMTVAAGLFLFGAGMGGGEVAMNVEGAVIEQLQQRSFLPVLHGCFSLGTVVGAVAGIVLTATDFPVIWHLVAVGAVAVGVLVFSIRLIPSGTGKRDASGVAADTARKPALWKDRGLLLIAVIILAMALAEGTANDWLPLIMVDGHGFDPALGSTVFAVFAAAMTVGRFVGGRFVDRFGRAKVLTVSALFGSLGLALVAFADNQVIAAAAVILWGLGASLGFPVALSAAGDSGPDSAARVSLVATAGYIAFLVGPPVLGFVGDEFGLRNALIFPLTMTLIAAAVAPRIGRVSVARARGSRS
jgi:fucose permease